MDKNTLLKAFSDFVDKHFTGLETEETKDIVKSIHEEQRLAMFVVLEPGVPDLHGDIYDADTVEKACHDFNMHSMQANLLHKVQTEKADIVESYITPAAFDLDDGRTITKGTWLQTWYFPEGDEDSEVLWKMVKDGTLTGLSVGCEGIVEKLGDSE